MKLIENFMRELNLQSGRCVGGGDGAGGEEC